MMDEYLYVDSAETWAAARRRLQKAEAVAFDLEADSMFHFREKICLLQMATRTDTVVVDPLAVTDLSPVARILENPKIRKVFHGADYDIRSLYRDFSATVENLFDTEMACRYLGLPASGLEAALRDLLSVQLDKRFQRKDWSMRPLPSEMKDYAASDVRFLLPLADLLTERLREKNRLSWVAEECELLSRVRPAPPSEGPLFLHCKGAGKLDRRGLAVLECLLQLRAAAAERKDRPVFKIIGSRPLLEIAARRPATARRLAALDVLSPKQQQMYGDAILQCVESVRDLPAEDLPLYPRVRAKRVSESVSIRIKSLKDWRERKAEALGIDPGLVLNKMLVVRLAESRPRDMKSLGRIEGVRQWQAREFGPEILACLHGAA